MKIGILGGTFDPVHNAHIEIANQALKQFDLDKVFLMPTPNPPHKSKNFITDILHRMNMLNLAIDGMSGLEVSDFESASGKVTYTADTLKALARLYPDDELFFIIGSDSLATFTSWYKPAEILKYAKLLVARRGHETVEEMNRDVEAIEKKFNVKIGIIDIEPRDDSSSKIRHDLDLSTLPMTVQRYIAKNNLYVEKEDSPWAVNEIRDDLEKILDKERFAHTIGVAETAKMMAESFDFNPNTAYLAGLLHDCAKNMDENDLLSVARDNLLGISDIERKYPFLLHAKVGAFIAETKYNVRDNDILQAICCHTTGKADMNILEKIIFAADYIEPNRSGLPRLDYLREISCKDLDLLVKCILENMMEHLKETKDEIDEHTIDAYNFYVLNEK